MKQTIKIEGEEYLSINDFAREVKRSYPAIYSLISNGGTQPDGSKVKLKSFRYNGSLYVPVSEVLDFTFATVGRSPSFYKYRFDENNELITVER